MVKHILFRWLRGILLGCVFGSIVLPTFANTPKVSMSDAVQRLQNSGYTVEDMINMVGNLYQAMVLDTSGQRVEVNVDATTGEVAFVKALPALHISWVEAAKILENKGYRVTRMENKGDHYRVDVYDSQNKPADLEVDKATGVVTNHVIG